jgi:hypothetical protein
MPAPEIKVHEDAARKAMQWLEARHRKGWLAAFEQLYLRLLGPQEHANMSRVGEDALSSLQINLTEWLLAEGQIQAQGSLRRISDYLIGPSGPGWTVGQRDWLLQMAQRPLRLYDVTDVLSGVGITLCDTLNGDAAPVRVQERSLSQALKPGMFLGCRLMRVGDHFELSGAAYAFSMLAGPSVAEQLRAIAEELGAVSDLAHEQGLVLMSAWLQQLIAPPPMPKMIDHYSGEPIVPITDHYRVLDEGALAQALNGCTDVEGGRLAGWARLMECDDGQIRSRANINPGKKEDQIEVFYLTQAYADQGRAWFGKLAAGSVSLLTRTVADAQTMMQQGVMQQAMKNQGQPKPRNKPRFKGTQGNGRQGIGAPGIGSPGINHAGIDPQELAQAMSQLILRSYANWADETIPALGNKTPRQAIKSAAGLERVKGLIRSYESGEKEQAAAQARPEISFEFLWNSIGVSR